MQKPPLWKGVSADKVLSPDNPIQQLVRRTIEEEIVETSTRVKGVDVWCNFLELCEDHWRSQSDVLLGVSGIYIYIYYIYILYIYYIYILYIYIYIYILEIPLDTVVSHPCCLLFFFSEGASECADVHFDLQ